MADKIATRDSYGRALVELGASDPNVVVLDADLSGSTKSGEFKKAYPDRFFNAGIAECDLMGMATGLAFSGKTAFASTFAMFATGRAYEIIRNSIAYTGANVKICATHAGLSVGEDGASHQCLEDISLMRGLPGMTVLDPADDVSARKLIKAAAEMQGPVYIRLGRAAVPVVYSEDDDIVIGKAVKLREGSDVTIMSTGNVLSEALAAADQLAEEGIRAAVLDFHTIKPIDEAAIIEAAKGDGGIVTVEDHFVTGGLGSAVAEVMAKQGLGCKVKMLGAQDRFGESGKPGELYKEYGIDAASIKQAATELCAWTKMNTAP
ncbi:MAG: transketolase family protein [Firmicutes bacterium]|nr:transketolase family protein [Bacillota bacterium]